MKDRKSADIKPIKMPRKSMQADGGVPQWHIRLGLKELKNITDGSTELIDWRDARKNLKV